MGCLKGDRARPRAPDLAQLLAPVIQEMDPEEEVEEQYKVGRLFRRWLSCAARSSTASDTGACRHESDMHVLLVFVVAGVHLLRCIHPHRFLDVYRPVFQSRCSRSQKVVCASSAERNCSVCTQRPT